MRFPLGWTAADADHLALDLPDVRVVVSRVLEDATLLIEAEGSLRIAQCHCYGWEIDRFHGFDRPILLCARRYLAGRLDLLGYGNHDQPTRLS